MAGFIRYWRITPADYRALTVAEHAAMLEFMRDEARARERARNQARRKARRRR